MVFMQVESAGNHRNFKQQALNSSSARSGVGPVPLDRAERAFRLNAPVHAKQCAVNAVQVFNGRRQSGVDLQKQAEDEIELPHVTDHSAI